jgi:hypothetical protein
MKVYPNTMVEIAIIALVAMSLALIACSENDQARNHGGTMTVQLPPGEKLVNVTWKDNDLWYLTRKRKEGEVTESLVFREKSGMGWSQGTVVLNEH